MLFRSRTPDMSLSGGQGRAPATPVQESQHTNNPVAMNKPAEFHGDRAKYKDFKLQVTVYVLFYQNKFRTDMEKIMWVFTYLRGTAQQMIAPLMIESQKPVAQRSTTARAAMESFPAFLEHLDMIFGEVDVKRKAEADITKIRQTTSAAKYAAEFQKLALDSQMVEGALKPLFYQGLKSHVQMELSRTEMPSTMEKMYTEAIRLDDWWYEHHSKGKQGSGRKGGKYRANTQRYRKDPDAMEIDATNRQTGKKDKGRDKSQVECYNCGKKGHYKRDCRSPPKQQANASNKKTRTVEVALHATTMLDDPDYDSDNSTNYPRHVLEDWYGTNAPEYAESEDEPSQERRVTFKVDRKAEEQLASVSTAKEEDTSEPPTSDEYASPDDELSSEEDVSQTLRETEPDLTERTGQLPGTREWEVDQTVSDLGTLIDWLNGQDIIPGAKGANREEKTELRELREFKKAYLREHPRTGNKWTPAMDGACTVHDWTEALIAFYAFKHSPEVKIVDKWTKEELYQNVYEWGMEQGNPSAALTVMRYSTSRRQYNKFVEGWAKRHAKNTLTNEAGSNTITITTTGKAREDVEHISRAEELRREHAAFSWTACYDDGCRTHLSEKEGSGWFPREPRRFRNKRFRRARLQYGSKKQRSATIAWPEEHSDRAPGTSSDDSEDSSAPRQHNAETAQTAVSQWTQERLAKQQKLTPPKVVQGEGSADAPPPSKN